MVSQIIFSPFYLELSLAKQGYEQLYRWATQGEWRYKASVQVLAACSTVKMPLQQISVVPARETASNGRSSMGRNKEKSKEVEVRGRFQFAMVGWVFLWYPVGLAAQEDVACHSIAQCMSAARFGTLKQAPVITPHHYRIKEHIWKKILRKLQIELGGFNSFFF